MLFYMLMVTFSVSDETIQGNFKSIEKSLKQVKGDVENCKKSSMEGDKFPEVMEISLLCQLSNALILSHICIYNP